MPPGFSPIATSNAARATASVRQIVSVPRLPRVPFFDVEVQKFQLKGFKFKVSTAYSTQVILPPILGGIKWEG